MAYRPTKIRPREEPMLKPGTKKIVCVWPDEGQWIVSIDVVSEEYGDHWNSGAIRTSTEDVCDEYEWALEEGRKLAKTLDLPLYSQDECGTPIRETTGEL
jgi:hypothetical protein